METNTRVRRCSRQRAEAGELAELIRGDTIEARAPTYRGMGKCFL